MLSFVFVLSRLAIHTADTNEITLHNAVLLVSLLGRQPKSMTVVSRLPAQDYSKGDSELQLGVALKTLEPELREKLKRVDVVSLY